jgi:hypothetical protein
VTTAPVRYDACHPGALVHQDHKKLGRIPDGGGWRVHGRRAATHSQGRGYDHLEVVVDDASRYAVVVPVPDETGVSARAALEIAAAEFARLGVRIERVLTDNGTGEVKAAITASPTAAARRVPPKPRYSFVTSRRSVIRMRPHENSLTRGTRVDPVSSRRAPRSPSVTQYSTHSGS